MDDFQLMHIETELVSRSETLYAVLLPEHSYSLLQDVTLEELAHYRAIDSQTDIITALQYLCHLYMTLGRQDDALTAIKEAVKLGRYAAQDDPTTKPLLAASLQYLGQHLANDSAQIEDAVEAETEAIQILREAVRKDPSLSAHVPTLAGSLHNLGYYIGTLGRWTEACRAMEEAVEIRRVLSQQDSATYLPLLASSLHNLSFHLSQLGSPRRAALIEEESVKLRRNNSGSITSSDLDLAESLHSLSSYNSALGRHQEAVATSSEQLQTVWHLVWDDPTTYMHHLAASLHNTATHLHKTGRALEAVTAVEESVHIRRELLTRDEPDVETHKIHLAQSLNTMASFLGQLGRYFEAILATEEAVALYRDSTCTQQLAFSLYNLGAHLDKVGRHVEALAARAEALKVYPDLLKSSRKRTLLYLADRVYALVISLVKPSTSTALWKPTKRAERTVTCRVRLTDKFVCLESSDSKSIKSRKAG